MYLYAIEVNGEEMQHLAFTNASYFTFSFSLLRCLRALRDMCSKEIQDINLISSDPLCFELILCL